MLSQCRTRNALLAAAVTVGCAAPAFANTMLPQPVQKGGVTYITGGIGDTERNALEASARNYDLKITNAEKNGDFTAGTDLVIQAKGGHDVLQARDTGPLFYAKLAPGEYVIRATYDGVQRVRDAKIPDKGTTDVHLIWPQTD